ncbi:MAG: metalloregulator ArsR/SmtB family transcription factor [Peptococcaceae bacterium MAG4]|jgi:ArsR family transcriptional regulator|nr:metalloregulator ArsR/SmtB family transcription factor [Peptococcaceae bacterium MAG4]NLW37846.1 winged helix-turn-helix transcriptional regulator [Peptococcaceae bacterium]
MRSEYVRVFRAFTDENRIRILEILSEGEQCACVLLDELKISQPTLSYHMKILCESGIIKSRRVGKWNYYSINADGCEYASRLLNAIVKHNIEGTLRVVRFAYRFLRCFGTLHYTSIGDTDYETFVMLKKA